MFKRVLLCYDGSEAGRRALKRGAELAILVGAQVYVLSIIPTGVADAAVVASAAGHACLVDEAGGYRRLLDVDLIVLGHYPHPSGGFWWGSPQRVSLAERANCCVFVAVNASAEASLSAA
jgi:nucleotide-binding universal stress UspA family protein